MTNNKTRHFAFTNLLPLAIILLIVSSCTKDNSHVTDSRNFPPFDYPVLTQISGSTPSLHYFFSTTQPGQIILGGNCSSNNLMAKKGINEIIFNSLGKNCTITVITSNKMSSLPLHVTPHSRTDSRPNIIVIVSDDQGYADIGIHGVDTDIKTPNIDTLAQQGIRMTSGYVTAPLCAPSRAAMITGKYQQRFGLENNSLTPLPLQVKTLAQRMKSLGYTTAHTGKWHMEIMDDSKYWLAKYHPEINPDFFKPAQLGLSERKLYEPNYRGFDYVYSGIRSRYWINFDDAGNTIPEQFITNNNPRIDTVNDNALTFIKTHSEEPFYLSVNYYAPHTPLEASDQYLSTIPLYLPNRRRYGLAMMATIDESVGNIISLLKQEDILKDTLIFYISDNGAILDMAMNDEDISIKRGWNGSLNTPLRGEKGMLTEGGIRVPYIMQWKGQLPENTIFDKPVSTLDIAATALYLAGDNNYQNLDGLNLMEYLVEPDNTERSLFWRFQSQRAVRKNHWKYLSVGNSQFEYLYDLDIDKEEQFNLIKVHPEIAASLKKALINWESEMKPPVLNGSDEERDLYHYYYGIQITP